MRRIVLVAALAAIVASALAPSAALAQRGRGRPPQPSAQTREAARAAYARGQQLFSEGDLVGAEAAFQEAYQHIPNPVVLLGLAEVRERAHNGPGAVQALEQYLAERTDAPDRAQVTERIAALRVAPALVVVQSDPPGASISVDGQLREETAPAELSLPPGSHEVVVSLDGHDDASETVEAVFGSRHELSLTLEPAADAPIGDVFDDEEEETLDDDEDEDEDEEGGSIPTAVWIASGLAGAALVAGTVLGFMALSEQADFDATPTESGADDGERLALFADVGFGVAAVAAITAIVLYLTAGEPADDSEDEEDGEDVALSLELAPAVGVRSAGVDARVRF